MTEQESAEYDILKLMTEDTHKFALDIGYTNDIEFHAAFERLQLRDWIRLLDVSPAADFPGRLFRIFRVMPDAVTWFRSQG